MLGVIGISRFATHQFYSVSDITFRNRWASAAAGADAWITNMIIMQNYREIL